MAVIQVRSKRLCRGTTAQSAKPVVFLFLLFWCANRRVIATTECCCLRHWAERRDRHAADTTVRTRGKGHL